MSNEPTIEQMDEAIALFMDLIPVPVGTKALGDIKSPEVSCGLLQYHSSWDCLMPVYEKISQIWTNASRQKQKQIEETYRAIQNRILLCSFRETIEHIYQFIQWYNKQKEVNNDQAD